MMANAKPPIYGVMAEFAGANELVEAAEKTRESGFRHFETYSPFPIEEMEEAMDLPHSHIPKIIFGGGLLGCLGGFYMQYWISAIAYPLNIGGRPYNSWPAFIPITFELTILLAALSAVVGLIWLNGMPRPYHPVFNVPEFERATQNRFFLVIESRDERFDMNETKRFLEGLGPLGVFEVDH